MRVQKHRKKTIGSSKTPTVIHLSSELDDDESFSSFNDGEMQRDKGSKSEFVQKRPPPLTSINNLEEE